MTQVITLIAIGGILIALALFVVSLWSLFTHREQSYKEEYEAFKARKTRIRQEIRDDRESFQHLASGRTDLGIRDFIYLDTERLYSLYSQVFSGVAETIVKSFSKTADDSQNQKGRFGSASSLEQEVAETSLHTESKLLHDYMYNLLEEELGSAIFEPGPVEFSVREKGEDEKSTGELISASDDPIGKRRLIRVTGFPVIQDFEAIREIVSRWPDIVDALVHTQKTSSEIFTKLQAARLQTPRNRDEKARLKIQIQSLEERLEKELMVYRSQISGNVPKETLQSVLLFIDLYYKNGFDILFSRMGDPSRLVFRGVLDRQWLRVAPETLRASYGSSRVANQWTMVGYITFSPFATEDIVQSKVQELEILDELSGMRDRFRQILYSMIDMEKEFMVSKDTLQYHIVPIAIYREHRLEEDRE